jgi:predicted nucleotidyltransferase
VFSVRDRDRVRDRVLEMASSDARVVAGAIVGSLARGDGDRWSDLDLTFAVAEGVPIPHVLEDWTRRLAEEFHAVQLFDLPSSGTIYRVFLLPGCLQFDLSFSSASEFGAIGPNFRMLFGTAIEKPFARPPSAHELFGYAVHHAVRARFCIERGRYWESEYWISGVRDSALSLACRRRDLPARYGRGFDSLPADVRNAFTGALVQALDREGLLRALGSAIDGLLREGDEVQELAARVEPQLRQLAIAWGA